MDSQPEVESQQQQQQQQESVDSQQQQETQQQQQELPADAVAAIDPSVGSSDAALTSDDLLADPADTTSSSSTVDPALQDQLLHEADSSSEALRAAAAESGATAAFEEAQHQTHAEMEREMREEQQQEEQAHQQNKQKGGAAASEKEDDMKYDFGVEFGIGSTKQPQQQQQHQPSNQYTGDASQRTFLTGVDNASQANLAQQQQQQQQHAQQQQYQQQQQQQMIQQQQYVDQQQQEANVRMSDEELIAHVEHQMIEYERTAQYLEAEKARQHLESLKNRFKTRRRDDLDKIQAEDIRVFFTMVSQHQSNFDETWSKKQVEHKLRADDLIESLKWKHEEQQRELYETLRRKRMPKFSVELLNMRKRQVLLAKSKNYISAEKVKRKGDILESIEIERIRESAKEENQLRFQTLLKKQSWDRSQLSMKLKIEKKCLLEAKAQDFLRLKKRLRNAEAELKKTHVRQQLLAEKKILPAVYSVSEEKSGNGNSNNSTATIQKSSSQRGNVLRNTGMQRMMSGGGGGSGSAGHQQNSSLHSSQQLQSSSSHKSSHISSSHHQQQQQSQPPKNARDLARNGRISQGQAIVAGGYERPGSHGKSRVDREEKEMF